MINFLVVIENCGILFEMKFYMVLTLDELFACVAGGSRSSSALGKTVPHSRAWHSGALRPTRGPRDLQQGYMLLSML